MAISDMKIGLFPDTFFVLSALNTDTGQLTPQHMSIIASRGLIFVASKEDVTIPIMSIFLPPCS
jgi:hypothetical protein